MLFIAKEACCGCGACASCCPRGCIQMREDGEGFSYPVTDEAACRACGLCESVCAAQPPPFQPERQQIWAAKARSSVLRRKSSSGGIFTLLAEEILERGGVVYGVAMDGHGRVLHRRAENKQGLAAFRGSKYVQSDLAGTFREAKADLEKGLWVLFSGTPCQIGGLRGFLRGRLQERLICLDMLCHGVPSGKIWAKYLREKGFGPGCEAFFRDKSDGWRNFALRIRQGKRQLRQRFSKTSFGRCFGADIMLRPSCYHCRYRGAASHGDITLGDFWGVEKVLPDFYDGLGVSLMIARTDAGYDLLFQCVGEFSSERVSFEDLLEGNSAAIWGVKPHPNREAFFAALDSVSLETLTRRYVKDPLPVRCKRYIAWKIAGMGAKNE